MCQCRKAAGRGGCKVQLSQSVGSGWNTHSSQGSFIHDKQVNFEPQLQAQPEAVVLTTEAEILTALLFFDGGYVGMSGKIRALSRDGGNCKRTGSSCGLLHE